MEKDTWALIMPLAPATYQSGYRWARRVWEEVWDVGDEEKSEGVAGAEGNIGGVGPRGANGSGSKVTTVEGEYGGRCLGEPERVEEGGFEPWEDGVGEEIGV
jgi:hypothetical protein